MRIFKEKGNGMDKRYYHDGNSKHGWLQVKDEQVEVRTRELQAYRDLQSIEGVKNLNLLPEIIEDAPGDVELRGNKNEEVELKPGLGYQIEHISQDISFKPKMQALLVMGQLKNSIGNLNEQQLKLMGDRLDGISNELEAVCGVVGELTLCFDKQSGRLCMLDVAPSDGVGGKDLAGRAKIGIENIKKIIDQRLNEFKVSKDEEVKSVGQVTGLGKNSKNKKDSLGVQQKNTPANLKRSPQ